jgi:hypothetical protein
MKSAWHIISVETERLNLPQFPTLSKYLKIYGAHAPIIYWNQNKIWNLLLDLIWETQLVIDPRIDLLLYYAAICQYVFTVFTFSSVTLILRCVIWLFTCYWDGREERKRRVYFSNFFGTFWKTFWPEARVVD